MIDLVWEDPPPPPSKYTDLAATLRAHPARWARWPYPIRDDAAAANLQRGIRRGRLTAFPRGDFEATARLSDGAREVYVRYVGTGTAAAAQRASTLRVVGDV